MSDNGKIISFINKDALKAALSQVRIQVDSAISNAITESTSSLTSAISSGDTNTLSSAKNYADGLKTTLDGTIADNLATSKGYTDGIKTALETNIDSYGVKSVSFDNQTSVLTITMKDNSSKTATISVSGGSGSGSSNGSEVTLASLGAAAASHTHTESDITDLGSYASSSHTHTESDITDLGSYATNSDLNSYGVNSISFNSSTNVLSLGMKGGSSKTVTLPTSSESGSSGSSSGSSSLFPTIARDEIYNKDNIVMSPTVPRIYFQALNDGFTDSSDTVIEAFSNVRFDPANNFEFTKSITDYDRDLTSYSYYKAGSIILDGYMIWITGDIMDGRQVGDIVFRPYDSYGQYAGYINLATGDPSFFCISTSLDKILINFKGARLLKKYIDDKSWINIPSSDLDGLIYGTTMSLEKSSNPTNNYLFEINFSMYNSTNLFDTFSTKYASYSDKNLLLHFAVIQILNQYLSNPLNTFYGETNFIENIYYLSSFDISQFNTAHSLSYTDEDYIDFTNDLIDAINVGLGTSGTSFNLGFKVNPINGYYPKLTNYQNSALMGSLNVPNYSDSTTSTINNIGIIPYMKY